MKATFVLAIALWSFAAAAQPAPALVPASPALTSPSNTFSLTVPALSGFTGAVASGTVPTNTTAVTNLTVTDVAVMLSNFQFSVQQALPVIAAFNNSFDLTGQAPAIAASTTGQTNATVQDTLRGMIVVQYDLQQLLPLLNQLNGGTNTVSGVTNPGTGTGAFGLNPGSLTNVFGP